jgi:TIR domain-containing protein
MRDTIFVSHANPDDNRFARWLALRLARDGYKVWSDVTGMLGGEDIWKDVERLLRDRTVKFIYVLSRASNQRDGVLQEVQIATTVARRLGFADFVIPAKIDDLPHADMNIHVNRLFATPFHESPAGGYAMLLEKLRRDEVPKNSDQPAGVVGRWWSEHLNPAAGISETPEDYLSNWFPITKMPHLTYFHELATPPPDGLPAHRVGVWRRPYLVSFAPPQDIAQEFGSGVPIRDTRTWATATLVEKGAATIARREARDLVSRILRISWERFVEARGLSAYVMANKVMCSYFTTKLVGEGRVPFRSAEGAAGSRQLVGHRTQSKRVADGVFEPVKQYWHYGIDARPLVYPAYAYALRAHVLFSHDGLNIWQSAGALHRTRRSACRDWWNDAWRDRLLASVSWLASGRAAISIEVGTGTQLEVGCGPLRFQSPVSYVDPGESAMTEDEDVIDENDDGEGPT